MLETYSLDTGKMIDYAAKWAYSYNPDFYDFTELGGDCTNFISQCVYAGGAVMNYTPDTGWYYIALSERAAAWTGVEFFARFVLNNRGAGPSCAFAGTARRRCRAARRPQRLLSQSAGD